MNQLISVNLSNIRSLGPHFCCRGSPFGPHFNHNQVPIKKGLGPPSMFPLQCGSSACKHIIFWFISAVSSTQLCENQRSPCAYICCGTVATRVSIQRPGYLQGPFLIIWVSFRCLFGNMGDMGQKYPKHNCCAHFCCKNHKVQGLLAPSGALSRPQCA